MRENDPQINCLVIAPGIFFAAGALQQTRARTPVLAGSGKQHARRLESVAGAASDPRTGGTAATLPRDILKPLSAAPPRRVHGRMPTHGSTPASPARHSPAAMVPQSRRGGLRQALVDPWSGRRGQPEGTDPANTYIDRALAGAGGKGTLMRPWKRAAVWGYQLPLTPAQAIAPDRGHQRRTAKTWLIRPAPPTRRGAGGLPFIRPAPGRRASD